jgi:DNA recombination protein RmuC
MAYLLEFVSLLLFFCVIFLLYKYVSIQTVFVKIQQGYESLSMEKDILLKTMDELKTQKESLEKKNSELMVASSRLEADNNNFSKLNSEIKAENESLRSKNESSTSMISKLTTENDNLKKRIYEIREEAEENKKNLTTQFQNLANNILERNSEKFTLQNRESLDNILKPLSEKIKNFNDQLNVSNKNLNDQNVSLRLELQKTIDLGNKMSLEAENLAKAIKGNTKIQGNWGENILEKILESSGLEKERDYVIQASFRTDEGKLYMPDVVVNLPGNKHVIVDSKMSLNNYEQYFNAENEDTKDRQLKLHFESVKKHINELAEKKYHAEYSSNGLDFVFMFIPIEQAYTLIIRDNQLLFEEAYRKNVIITSPSTLIPTLRIIADIWKKEKQNQNAMFIAQQAGALYDKFVGFVEDLKAIGKSLENAKNEYLKATNKLYEGKGNIVSRAENIKLLGAKTTKALDNNLVELSK